MFNSRTFSARQRLGLIALAFGVLSFSGCGGGGSGTDNSVAELPACRDPLVIRADGTCGAALPPVELPACPDGTVRNAAGECVVPDFPLPTRMPGANEVVIYVNSEEKDFSGYNLHLWQSCGNGWGDSIVDGKGTTYPIPTTWPNGPHVTSQDSGSVGITHDPYYGAFFVIPTSALGSCGNFIIKTPGGAAQTGDLQINIKRDGSGQFDRMGWVIINSANMRNSRFSTLPICINDVCTLERPLLSISDVEAHWISARTIIWNREFSASKKVELYNSTAGGMAPAADGKLTGGSLLAQLGAGRPMTDDERALVPHLANYIAYDLPTSVSLDAIKAALKDELIIIGRYDSVEEAGTIERGRGTRIQVAKALDDLYTKGSNDADEAKLGVSYSSGVGVSVWAPTAQEVDLRIYSGDPLKLADSKPMNWNAATGIWTYTGTATELDRKYYRFRIKGYSPVSKKVQRLEVTDPYSISLSTNGRHSQFVNLNDSDLKPAGWDGHMVPTVAAPEMINIYETHIRDFSANDQSTSAVYRGKYMAFTQSGTAPVNHLQELVDAGMTHIHFLPSNDSSSIKESSDEQVNLDSYIFELCQKVTNPDSVDACDGSESNASTLREVLESYDPTSDKARKLMAAIGDLDAFNWGYDPQHFNAPEGSYASDPMGFARIKEMRAMNMALHNMGLRVVMDVVYPHTISSGLDVANSVFDKVVPGYYYRTNPATALAEQGTGAGPDTATENRMMGKFVQDSVVQWAEAYKVDGFRFDQSGFMPKSVLVDAYNAVKAVDEDSYFYAEAWTPGGGTSGDRIVERSTQEALAGTGIGTFNDRMRNPLQQLALIKGEGVDAVRVGLAGNLKNFKLKTKSGAIVKAEAVGAYNLDPQEAINYVEKHDNEALWDWIHRPNALPANTSRENRVRIHNLTLSLPVLSQGVPFFQMGSDLLRSKSMSPNSYNAGDWFNAVDFTKQSNNWGVGLPPELRDGITDTYVLSQFADSQSKPLPADIAMAGEVFQEFLSIASSSPLFSLQTEQEVLDRVGFHDGGKTQVAGLIVMSIDDGAGTVAGTDSTARADLDPANDALVVVVNGSNQTQVAMVPTATGFSLHSTQKASADATVKAASFAEATGNATGGSFSVPAYTTAVFVKAQAGAQGAGLSASASLGAAVPVPYGDTAVYVRGGVSAAGWDATAANRMAYEGGGVYSVLLNVPAGNHEFKIAEANWSSPNLGSNATLVPGGSITLTQGSNDNIHLNVATAGIYRFELDASSSTTAPTLKVTNPDTFGAVPVYLRGTVTASGWDANAGNQLVYQGNSLYAVTSAMVPGDYMFKVASSDWSTFNMGSNTPAQLGQPQILTQGSNDNVPLTITKAATYRFEVNTRNADAPTVRVYEDDLFAATPIYVRGTITPSGWDANAGNRLTYAGAGLYTLTVNVAMGSYQFKIAETNWSNPNLGGTGAAVGEAAALTQGSNDNLAITIPVTGTYRFTVDTTQADAITVRVDLVE
ncbi:alpha-1,6-glucosidase domain-containing protein [Cellvibrio fibrivorans]|uniref:Pullulanase n=1 Tax=Cellvibrio fibrivorans TaxID=126350 RepID=A0ABU1UZP8_9GAMM|nr:alpha-1,6-glucosidase domain-containing protein [Cellvibrio fibrivorans]MDR7090664.1 pullulanase [Cellvibrio fibrivorans]